jgi:predicted amidophosphoribosyltransferase
MNRYRLRYYWFRLVGAFGFCARCWNRVNYTTTGRAICPQCGKAI